MLLTLRITYWRFTETFVWYSDGTQLSALRKQRHALRLEKQQEKQSLIAKRKSLTNWRDLVILFRVITKRSILNMIMW